MRIPGYGKIWNLGHANVSTIFDSPVVVQPKIDGSQGSFGVFEGELHLRSKGATVHVATPNKLFTAFSLTASRLFEEGKLTENWVYRGEVLYDKRHNTLAYDRVPAGNFILFDVEKSPGSMCSPEELKEVADSLGLECVPTIFEGNISSIEEIMTLLDRDSVLGGTKEEGIVVKNYSQFGIDGKVMMAKVVRPDFRESNRENWSQPQTITERIIETYANENRWRKSIQHMTEEGQLTNSHKDIGPLLGAIAKDVHEECSDEIKEILFKHFWKGIARGVARGFPEFYKQYLIESQFDASDKES